MLLWCLPQGLLASSLATPHAVTQYDYRIVASYPHSVDSFTQGLEYRRGLIYESAGRRGQSRIFKRPLHSVEPLNSKRLPRQYFAEGLSLLDNKLFQLTWQSGRGFIYDPDTLEKLGDFPIDGEGWGMTNDGKHLITSDGTSRIRFIDPNTLATVRTVNVSFDGNPLVNLNELEWIDGILYANIWQSHWIVMIDPGSGHVIGKVYLKDLLPDSLRTAKTGVLNGIAFDHHQKRLLVTGKYWPRIYHIELIQIP